MIRLLLLSMFGLMLSAPPVLANAKSCPVLNPNLSIAIRQFAVSNKLIDISMEQELKEIGMVTQWQANRIVPSPVGCLAVLHICTRFKGSGSNVPPECDTGIAQVVALKLNKSSPIQVQMFETAVALPQRLFVALGSNVPQDGSDEMFPENEPNTLRNDFWFAEFSAKSVVEILKSYYASTPVSGFTGLVVKGQRVAFDTTLNRNWKIHQPLFDLGRGHTAEVMDFRAAFFDSDFDGYFNGAVHKQVTIDGKDVTGALVGPWNAVPRMIMSQDKWIEVYDKKGNLRPVQLIK